MTQCKDLAVGEAKGSDPQDRSGPREAVVKTPDRHRSPQVQPPSSLPLSAWQRWRQAHQRGV